METAEKQEVWTTANGKKIPLSELTHQHISNILWFFEILHGVTHPIIDKELHDRFNGERLLWRPLPISGEIAWLRRNGYIVGSRIIKRIGLNKHVLIGEIGHINPENN